MKISLVICIFLAVNVYGRSVKVKRQASCKSVEYDLGMVEFNQFVSNEMKAEVCAKNIVNYNSHSRIPIKYLGGEYNYITHQNPCTVVCRYDPSAHESIVDAHSTSVEHTAAEPEPAYTLNEYRALPMGLFHVAEKTVCGPQHMCDVNGCCVKEEPQPEQPEEHKEPETPVEHKEPEAPEEPHHEPEQPAEHQEPETPVEHKEPEVPEEHIDCSKENSMCSEEPEHKEPEVPEEHKEPEAPEEPHHEPETPEEHKEPETPVEHPEEHKEPEEPKEPHEEPEEPHHEPEQPKEPEVPEKEYACKEPGVFADDEDETSFFYCYLKSAHIKCAEGTVFSKATNQCAPLDPHYAEHITCAHEGYFRNPYDCNRFYRCYYNDATERANGHLRVAFYQCSPSMVFDNTAQTCVMPAHTQACDNILLNVQTHLYRQ
jgi:hypothetical protein